MFFTTLVIQQKYGVDLVNLLGLHFFSSSLFKPFQLISHMFMHGSFLHIFSNMFALWMFGSALENVWGPKRFLIFYFVCGLGGAVMHLGVTWFVYSHMQSAIDTYALHPDIASFATLTARYDYLLNSGAVQSFIDQWKQIPKDTSIARQSVDLAYSILKIYADIPIVGASGAVFGVLVAFGMLFPNTYLYVYFFVPVKAKYFVFIYAAFELYAGFSGAQDNVAHFAHIGGAVIGFLLVKYWNRNRRIDFY